MESVGERNFSHEKYQVLIQKFLLWMSKSEPNLDSKLLGIISIEGEVVIYSAVPLPKHPEDYSKKQLNHLAVSNSN